VVFPASLPNASSREALYAFSALTPLHPALWDGFQAQASLVERVELAPTDENPSFEIWRWQGQEALAETLEALAKQSPVWVSPEVQFVQPELRRTLDERPAFGDVMTLVGYRLDRSAYGRGDDVELITYWRALRTVVAEDDWNTFVHLLDKESRIMGGVDVLHAPPTGWLPGDVIVQVHPFQVAPDAPLGEAQLELGVYRRGQGRVPVTAGGEVVGDRVLLAPVEIE
jgi:hypothetical protein